MRFHRDCVLLLFLVLQGCGSVTSIRPDGSVERHYFGYTKIVTPNPVSLAQGVTASDITSIGIRVESGVGFGYFHDREVATPLDCRLVFLVQDQAQLDKTTQFLQTNMKGNDICAAIY